MDEFFGREGGGGDANPDMSAIPAIEVKGIDVEDIDVKDVDFEDFTVEVLEVENLDVTTQAESFRLAEIAYGKLRLRLDFCCGLSVVVTEFVCCFLHARKFQLDEER